MKNKVKKSLAVLLVLVFAAALMAGCASNQAATTSSAAASEAASPSVEASASASASAPAAESSAPAASGKALKMAMITDTGGLGDKGFNDTVWAGMQKAKTDFGYDIKAIESTQAADYGPNIEAAAQQGFDVVVCVGYLFVDALGQVAAKYPDTKFVMIDGEVKGDNVYSYQFDVEQSSFLAGALAGLVQKDSKAFGFVGGMEIPVTDSWLAGYEAGVKTTNPSAKVLSSWVGTFADPGKAKELALKQFNAGANVVLECSSGGAVGVAEAAKAASKKFIATDSDKDALATGCQLTAALCKRDQAVYAVAKMISEGTAKPGTTYLTIKDGIFGLPDNTSSLYGADIAGKIQKLTEMITNGEIKVPTTLDALKTFQAPQI